MGLTVATALPAMVIVIIFSGRRSFALDIARPFFEHPGYLLLLLAANAVVLVFRILAGLDAFWRAGGGFTGKRVAAVVTAITIFAVAAAAPHAWAAQRNLALYDLFTHDYSVDPNQAAPPITLPTLTTIVSETPRASTTTPPATSTPTTATATTTTRATTTSEPTRSSWPRWIR